MKNKLLFSKAFKMCVCVYFGKNDTSVDPNFLLKKLGILLIFYQTKIY